MTLAQSIVGGTPQKVHSGRFRVLGGLLLAVVLLAGAVVTVYRVLAPAEVSRGGLAPVPAVRGVLVPGVIGSFSAAPVSVDGRVRVYASARQVRADAPVGAHTQRSPVWSFRRWPGQLTAVAVTGTTVVTRWSDDRLVALDALTGRELWRAQAPPLPGAGYLGRRTGAATLLRADGLLVAGAVVIATGADGQARGYDAGTGRELWRAEAGCAAQAWTAGGVLFAPTGCDGSRPGIRRLATATGAPLPDWAGAVGATATPLGCVIGRSACAGVRLSLASGGSEGWLLDPAGGAPVPAPALAPPGAWLVDGRAVTTAGGAVTARPATGGEPVWTRRTGPIQVIGAQPGRVHLLTPDRDLLTLDPADGRQTSRFRLAYGRGRTTDWEPGLVVAYDGLIAVELLRRGAAPTSDDTGYYVALQPVLLAAV